jgi:hypothetical protein
MSLDRLDGKRLSDGVLQRRFRGTDQSLVGVQVTMNLAQQTFVGFGTYAVSNTIDVGVSVPFVKTTLSGAFRDADGRILTEGFFDQPIEVEPTSGYGLGDIQARAKWNVARSAHVDGAVQVDFWLPTGDAASLASKQRFRERLSALVSLRSGAFEQHFNVGYTFRLAGESPVEGWFNFVPPLKATPNVLSYTAGSTWAVNERVTVMGEFVGRYVRDGVVFRTRHFDPADSGVFVVEPAEGQVNQALGAFGAKVRITGTTVIGAHLLMSLTHTGLSIRPTAILGVEHAF